MGKKLFCGQNATDVKYHFLQYTDIHACFSPWQHLIFANDRKKLATEPSKMAPLIRQY